MANDWPIPEGLDPRGRLAAELIYQFFVDKGITEHGDSDRFHLPAEWNQRWGRKSLLIITHDGGAHSAAFNEAYEQHSLMAELRHRLSTIGLVPEHYASWYTGIRPLESQSE
ncbi:hypothetical protein [Rhodococcus sp. KRD162]|jgi:hypothetical protein|uniref:Uncharacterized protein n=1 Tax=Rhodococcus baikonurensis TaxID=172041 RepID=A0ABV5XAY1_9NOCA|nr:hypothetical protein [Rhodococcus sp. KRD162]